MSEKEMKSYRFGTGQEPTNEMLEQVMKEVAQEARESSKKAADAYFEQMRRNIALNKANWEERINSIINEKDNPFNNHSRVCDNKLCPKFGFK